MVLTTGDTEQEFAYGIGCNFEEGSRLFQIGIEGFNTGRFESRQEFYDAVAPYVREDGSVDFYNFEHGNEPGAEKPTEEEFYDTLDTGIDMDSLLNQTYNALFEGLTYIDEREGKIVYTPSSRYCGIKTFVRWMGLPAENGTSRYEKGYSPHGSTLEQLINFWAQNSKPIGINLLTASGNVSSRAKKMFYSFCPAMYLVKRTKDSFKLERYKPFSSDTPDKIFITKYGKEFHMSYARAFQCEHGDIHLCAECQHVMLEETEVKLLTDKKIDLRASDWMKMQKMQKRKEYPWCLVYDNECYVHEISEKVKRRNPDTKKVEDDVQIKKHLYACTLQFQIINLKTKHQEPIKVIIADEPDPLNPYDSIGKLYDKMFTYAHDFAVVNKIPRLIVYAYNGARFDHIFAKSCKGVKFVSEIRSGGTYKEIVLSKGKVRFVLRDPTLYLAGPTKLSQACKDLKVPKQYYKLDFDISDMSYSDYAVSKDLISSDFTPTLPSPLPEIHKWLEYGIYDVHALREVVFALHDMYYAYGCSITSYMGIPSMSWDIMRKSCIHLDKMVEVSKDPLTQQFLHDAVYGGRVFAWQRFAQNLVEIDANSLYPSTMANMSFPIGKPELMTPDFDLRSEYNYVCEIIVQAPNIPHGIIPVRLDKTVIYPTNTFFTGVYYSQDVKEMLEWGYIVHEIKQGLFWRRSAKIFSQIIPSLYDARKALKKEGNSLESAVKLIINSSYGSNLLSILSQYIYTKAMDSLEFNKFCRSKNMKGNTVVDSFQLPNGQFEVQFSLGRPVQNKPTHIGGMILAGARAYMNKMIRLVGVEHVAYSDTDSLYITYDRYKECMLNPEFSRLMNVPLKIVSLPPSYFKQEHVISSTENTTSVDPEVYKTYISDSSPYKLPVHEVTTEPVSPDKLGLELLGFKSDYGYSSTGEFVIISEMYCLDLKRYLLVFPDGTSRAKFNGLSFSSGKYSMTDFKFYDAESTKKLKVLYNELWENYINFDPLYDSSQKTMKEIATRWVREKDHVVIQDNNIAYTVNPSERCKYDLSTGRFYSLGYNKNQKKPFLKYYEYLNTFTTMSSPLAKPRKVIICPKPSKFSTPIEYKHDLFSTSNYPSFTVENGFVRSHLLFTLPKVVAANYENSLYKVFAHPSGTVYISSGSFTFTPCSSPRFYLTRHEYDADYILSPSGLSTPEIVPSDAKFVKYLFGLPKFSKVCILNTIPWEDLDRICKATVDGYGVFITPQNKKILCHHKGTSYKIYGTNIDKPFNSTLVKFYPGEHATPLSLLS